MTVLPDTVEVYLEWHKLVTSYEVKGVQVHAARLVAAMLAHGIDRILTYNTKDFQRYNGIPALQPGEI